MQENSFEIIARKWFKKNSSKWSAPHGKKILRRLEKDIFPWIGNDSISEISSLDLLSVFKRMESRGAIETANRAYQNCNHIFSYAINLRLIKNNPTNDLKNLIPPINKKSHASLIKPIEVAQLLNAIEDYEGELVTKYALRLAALVFVTPNQLRAAEWSEFNFNHKEWIIPEKKMRMNFPHIIPLSTQAIAILQQLQILTGNRKYLFPSIRSPKRCMSNNTILGALRRLGYSKDEMTGHGFRLMAFSLLSEQGWNKDIINSQLGKIDSKNKKASKNYDSSKYLFKREKMMQHWADYLDIVRSNY
jgi:integrase